MSIETDTKSSYHFFLFKWVDHLSQLNRKMKMKKTKKRLYQCEKKWDKKLRGLK
jgi:hypothetical protein